MNAKDQFLYLLIFYLDLVPDLSTPPAYFRLYFFAGSGRDDAEKTKHYELIKAGDFSPAF
jgi:hypothetical protein